MKLSKELRQKLADAEKACWEALGSAELEEVTLRVRCGSTPSLVDPDKCFALIKAVTADPSSPAELKRLKRLIAGDSPAFERWMLLKAMLAGVKRAEQEPVVERVKLLWAEEALAFAQPPPASLPMFTLGHVRYGEMAQIATWRRFPAGQFHWELSGFPRSSLARTPLAELPRVLIRWLLEVRGFSPFFEPHVNDRRKNRLSLTEAEGIKSYYLMARSLELQPNVLGLAAFGWLFSPATGEVSPQLDWMRGFPLKHGAVAVSSVGPARPDAGFLVGSAERRRLYEQGRYKPTIGYLLWPRRAMIEWAKRNGDPFDDSSSGAAA